MVNRILALFALLVATATAATTTVTALAFGTVFPATTFGVAAVLSSSSVPFSIKNNNHQKNTFSTVLSLSSHRHHHQQQQQQQQIKTQLYRIRGGSSSSSSSLLNLSPAFIRMAETLAPKIGVITSTALYLAPAVAVMKAIQSNDRGDLNPIPLAVMSTSSLAWLVYGIIVQDPYVTLSNIGGTIASMGYIVGLLPLLASASSSSSSQDQNHNNNTNSVLLRQTQYVLMAGVSMTLLLWTYLGLTVMGVAPPFVLSIEEVGSVLGIFASILFILLSASPLSTIRTVITTKSSKSILGPFMIAQCLNTSLWTMYGLAIKNKFVWGPNSVGLGLGLVQLALKLAFP